MKLMEHAMKTLKRVIVRRLRAVVEIYEKQFSFRKRESQLIFVLR